MKKTPQRAPHKTLVLALLLAAAAGCDGRTPAQRNCANLGGSYSIDGVASYCGFAVITGTFSCPEGLPFRLDLPGSLGNGAICSSTLRRPNEVPLALCTELQLSCGSAGDGGVGDAIVADAAGDSSSGVIERCEATVNAYISQCQAEDPNHNRLCGYPGYRNLCRSGRPEAVERMFNCLSQDACQSPSDPSAATDCVDELRSPVIGPSSLTREVDIAIRDRVAQICAGSTSIVPDLLLVSQSTAESVLSCLNATQQCVDTIDCVINNNIEPFATANACNAASCERVVDDYASQCQAEDPTHGRLCLYPGYRRLCRSGRPNVISNIFSCLSSDACQTPSDPSNATDCIDAISNGSDVRDIDRQIASRAATLCGNSNPAVSVDLMMFTTPTARTLLGCMNVATDCPGAEACIANLEPYVTANTCPNL